MGFRLLLVAVLETLQETEIHKLSYFKGIHFKSIIEVHLSYVQKFEISPLTSQKVSCTCFYVTYSFFNRAWNNFFVCYINDSEPDAFYMVLNLFFSLV